jgi:hypothetical protein
MRPFFTCLLLSFSFFACNEKNGAGSGFSTEPLDTIQWRPAKVDAKPVLFEEAFIKGTTKKINNSTVSLNGITIGKIKIASGLIIACDPMHIDEYGIPFTQIFPNGDFPVQLSIAKVNAEETIAFARISFSEEPVAKWEFALQKGQLPIPPGGEKMHGYSVDAGVGIFIDKDASKALGQEHVTNMDTGIYKEMDKHRHYDWRYTMYNFGAHNLAAFSTGFGDGYFVTYIGFDANGTPCRLLTDFNVIDWKKK